MRKYNSLYMVIMLLFTGACTYKGSVDVKAAYNIYSNYEDKVLGKWAIYSDGSKFKTEKVDMDGVACSLHSYPLDAVKAFEQSAFQTFANLVENIELVEVPIAAANLSKRGFDGQIIVTGERLRTELTFIQGFWAATARARIDFTASVSAVGREGRLLGTTASDDGIGKGDAGIACEGGAKAVADGASDVIYGILTKLGERFANSNRVRAAAKKN